MPIPCPDCQRAFVDKNALLQHRKHKHRLWMEATQAFDAYQTEAAIDVQQRQMAGEWAEDWEEPYLS